MSTTQIPRPGYRIGMLLLPQFNSLAAFNELFPALETAESLYSID